MNLNTVSDKIVFSILKDIKVGNLELSNYDGKNYSFGNIKDPLKANIKIKNKNFTFNLIKSGSVGLAESYMKDDFETNNLSNLIEITARNIKQIHKFSGLLDLSFINYLKSIFVKNTKNRSKTNISKHYDLGNEFFSLWLDKTLTYSSAIFDEKNKNLSDAQNNKYQKLIDLIKPRVGDKVLEIGTGSGYQTSILIYMKSRVYTLERIFDLHRMAKTTLSKLKMHPEKIKWSDGYLGLSENAPFDKILVTAGCPNIPTELLNQLSINGKMIIPVGLDDQEMCLVKKVGNNDYSKKTLGKFNFVPMLKDKI